MSESGEFLKSAYHLFPSRGIQTAISPAGAYAKAAAFLPGWGNGIPHFLAVGVASRHVPQHAVNLFLPTFTNQDFGSVS